MDKLLQVIEDLRKRIKDHRDLLSKSEALTRYVLIDPLLRALGWDTENPDRVRPEFSTSEGTPDYALILGGEPLIMVEAKALGADLSKAQDKGFQYCWKNKVRFFAVSDGDKWRVSDVQHMGGQELLTATLSAENPGDTARRLLALWYPAMPELKPPPPSVVVPPPPPPPAGNSLSDLRRDVKYGQKPPEILVLPDGARCSINKWKNLLVEVARSVLPDLVAAQKVPIKLTKNYLVSRTSSGLGSTVDLGGGYWLETSVSALDAVGYACRLVELAGKSPEDFRVEWAGGATGAGTARQG